MTTWDWIFGVIGVIGVIFSIYTYLRSERAKIIEACKQTSLLERIDFIHLNIISLFNGADGIVQASKEDDITPKHLGDMTRVLRSQAYLLAKSARSESTRLRSWRFGKLIESKSAFETQDNQQEKENLAIDD